MHSPRPSTQAARWLYNFELAPARLPPSPPSRRRDSPLNPLLQG
jgi:hypothetical protein